MDKEKICHDLSVEFAKIKAIKNDDCLKDFPLDERMLIDYEYAFRNLTKNYDKILKDVIYG